VFLDSLTCVSRFVVYIRLPSNLIHHAFMSNWEDIRNFYDIPLNNTFTYINDSTAFDYDNWYIYLNTWKFGKDLLNVVVQLENYHPSRFCIDQPNPNFFDVCAKPKYYSTLLKYSLVKNETIESALNILRTVIGLQFRFEYLDYSDADVFLKCRSKLKKAIIINK